jgi:hypothetical protein
VFPAPGVVPTGKSVIHQGIEIGVGHREYVPAAASVTPVRATELFVFFVPERDAASPAVSSRDIDVGFVNKLHGFGYL